MVCIAAAIAAAQTVFNDAAIRSISNNLAAKAARKWLLTQLL